MTVHIKKAYFLTALVLFSALLLIPTEAGAAAPCTPAKPQITWRAGNVRWNSFQDYRGRRLSVDMLFTSAGAQASGVNILGVNNSDGITVTNQIPYALGDIVADGAAQVTLTYIIPAGVPSFRTSLYVSAQDACGDKYYYPRPLENITRYSTGTSDNGRGQMTVDINWDTGFDTNNNAVATIKYRMYPSNSWDGGQPAYTTAGTLSHSGATGSLTINSLRPGRYYDFRVEVTDSDGVDGVQPQTESGKLLRDDRFVVANILNNPHPGPFDEVRVRDFYNNSLYWYSSQSYWEEGPGYEYLLRNGTNYEYSMLPGKTAWQSVTDRPNNRLFIAGELPRYDGSRRYRAMLGVINQNTNSLNVYYLPFTDDCNELIGIAHDTAGNRILTGERRPGTPLIDSWWPNGGGLWSIPVDSLGDSTKYARIYQDPLNRTWDKMVVFNGRLYAIVYDGSGTLISAALSDVPTSTPMSPDAWRTEISSRVFSMIVSPTHGLVVAQGGYDNYLSLHVNNGSGWRTIESNQVYAGEGLYELSDHRFLVMRDNDGSSHHVGVASVNGEWENLGIYPGGWPSYNYAADSASGIYYGTATPGKVWKIVYSP